MPNAEQNQPAAGLTAQVSRMLRWSVVDGPGNRMVLFLQGCPFDCPSCHNPHTIGRCDHCGDCLAVCPGGALLREAGRVVYRRDACTHCDACLKVCPRDANPKVQTLGVAAVLALLREQRAFLNGITLSGGEPTGQHAFIAALFAAIKAAPDLCHLSCFIDSNGHFGARGWDRLLPLTDGVMLDIKALDPGRHRHLTGRDPHLSLASAHRLARAGKLHELRFLLIPGQTDQPEEITALIALMQTIGLSIPVRLNAFHHHGVRAAAQTWPAMTRERLLWVADCLRAGGVQQVITPAVWLPA
ncbi:YjjW family glycine radical enzyme activase [Paludibacterium sp. B53371]|uniref:YjjW family glycine radical enzyme activase n=1 Tax=Paludibacterium sp. B53371 TaxID=2806263 RepID=UPI001C047556|nr:YjjW family glycine radical enzyme activase [Paludibacterium sp. B53371]